MDNISPIVCERDLNDKVMRQLLQTEVVSLKIDLQKDLTRLMALLQDHRVQSKDFIVYSLLLCASDAGKNKQLKTCHSWQV